MIQIVALSPENELPVARRLERLIRSEWPDIAASPEDRVRIFAGLHLNCEIDLAVEISLARERPVRECRLRDGQLAPAATIVAGLLVVEVKQLARERFEISGAEIFPIYGRRPSTRSVAAQVNDGVVAVRAFLAKYLDRVPFVHGLGWLTDVPEAELQPIAAYVVGSESTWSSMLQAAGTESRALFDDPPDPYRCAIATFGTVLTNRRNLSPPDRAAVDRLTGNSIANGKLDEVISALGARQVRLAGGPGSGKSTTFALLADYVVRVRQERTLVLTYNHALCRELERLIRSTVNDDALVDRHVRVATLLDYLVDVCIQLGADLPHSQNGIDYARLEQSFRELLETTPAADLRTYAGVLAEQEPSRYAFDYVCLDEAQDCLDSERDLLRALHPPERLVLADGLDQLVRRQTPCDWTTGVERSARCTLHFPQSLRMSHNVAAFATAMARAMGRSPWRIVPHESLSGGRVVVLRGGYDRTTVAELADSLDAAGASRKDALVCVPPSDVFVRNDRRESRTVATLRDWGYAVWDGADQDTRHGEMAAHDQIRVVQYHSMRGLEGWLTILVALDDAYANRLKHPNLQPDDRRSPEDVAKSWLLMALTRAARTLVVTLANPDSEVAGWIRRASESLPQSVVEWYDADEKGPRT